MDNRDEVIAQINEQISKQESNIKSVKSTIARLESERITALKYANEKFAKELLPIIDALQNAQNLDVSGDESAANVQKMINECVEKFIAAFKSAGIEEINDSGKFDPNFHNAIQMLEIPGKESGDIVQVYQKGYKYKDRVLRASMVVIAK